MPVPNNTISTLSRWRAGSIGVLTALSLWEAFARLHGNPLIFPWPSYVVDVSFPSLAIFGGASSPDVTSATLTVIENLTVTLRRIALGLVLGFIGGTFAGFAIHYLKPTAKGNALFLTALRSVPLFALIPLFVYWFAGHEGGVWGYIAFATFIIVASGVYQAVFNVPRKYLVQSHLLGASEMDQFQTVIVNAIIPEMVGTIRNVLGLSWAFSLGAEYTATTSGLGYLVYQSYLYADMGKLIALASVYSFCALLVFAVWNKMATHLTRWAGSI